MCLLKCKEHSKQKNELNIMVEDIDPHIIGIIEYWATTDISDTELGMTEYVMFRKDRLSYSHTGAGCYCGRTADDGGRPSAIDRR